MKVCIIGQGAIAEYARTQLAQHNQQQQQRTKLVDTNNRNYRIEEVAQIVRPGKEKPDAFPPRYASIHTMPESLQCDIDLVVDCAGHSALIEHGPVALLNGIDVMTVSLGALADAALYQQLQTAAAKGNARLTLASGAIGGLDTLRSAAAVQGGLDKVTYIGRKPPAGWKGSPAETKFGGSSALCAIAEAEVHFTGTAREAALRYPKNANVAAAVALAGIGFDRTSVKLIADPTISSNIHEIKATGAFGEMHFNVAGKSLPENPRSSALAAMSVVAGIVEHQRQIGFYFSM